MNGMTAESGRAAAPRPRRPRGRPGHTRDDVLRQAIGLFNRRGYDAASISDLARELGVTKSAVFYHFDSKESMLAAALDEALDALSDAVADGEQAVGGSDAYDRLRSTVHASVTILVQHLPAVTLLLRVRGNSPLEQQALQRRRDLDNRIAVLVQNAVQEGRLRGDIAPDVISRLIFGMVNSLTEWYQPAGAVDESTLAASVTSVLFDGLGSDHG
jgi:AcrR family transcriptional regulator